MKETLTLQIEIPLIKRSDRFISADGNAYFVATTGEARECNLRYNLFCVDNYGNRVFPESFDSLEKLSTATYDFLGNFEVQPFSLKI